MKLCMISHTYLERDYQPALAAMASYPGIEMAWVAPKAASGFAEPTSGLPSDFVATYEIFFVPIFFPRRQGAFLYNPLKLAKALDTFKPDIILHELEVFSLSAGEVGFMAAKRGIPVVMFVSENLPRQLAMPRRMLMRYVFRHSAAIITVSRQAAERHRIFGFTGPIETIPQLGPSMNPHPVFGRRDPQRLQVCFAGRLVPSKGVDCLLRAIAELKGRGVAVHCTIAGQGDHAEICKALSRTLGIAAETTFAGSLPLAGVAAMLSRSDVLVLPSRRDKIWEEQFGRILTEAMAEATVTVGSRTGAIPEVIGSDELTFEQDDVSALTNILQRLAKRSRLSRNAAALALGASKAAISMRGADEAASRIPLKPMHEEDPRGGALLIVSSTRRVDASFVPFQWYTWESLPFHSRYSIAMDLCDAVHCK